MFLLCTEEPFSGYHLVYLGQIDFFKVFFNASTFESVFGHDQGYRVDLEELQSKGSNEIFNIGFREIFMDFNTLPY